MTKDQTQDKRTEKEQREADDIVETNTDIKKKAERQEEGFPANRVGGIRGNPS